MTPTVAVFLLLFFSIPCFAQGHGKVIYWSPDGTLQAIISPAHIQEPDFHEHVVEIKTKDGKLICKVDHSSKDHEHGRCVLQAGWSPDSRFFAYSTTSSGGHSCWHASTFCYVRKKEAVFYLDELVGGPLVDPNFIFLKPAVFLSKRLNYEDGKEIEDEPIPVKADLNKIEFRKEYAEPTTSASRSPAAGSR